MSQRRRLPTFFIPHGGGPCFFMKPGEFFPAGTWDRMAAYLRGLPGLAGTSPPPRSILIISAHWEEPVPTTYAPAERPSQLLYDYYGFPAYTYELAYPAPADPVLAAEVRRLLYEGAGMETRENITRGFDHGVFIPLMLSYPGAQIPIAQLSLCAGYDPARHLAIGRALAPLRDEGVLIIASGLSYHNLRALANPAHDAGAAEFDAWLTATVTDPDGAARDRALLDWTAAPSAQAAHPQAEHFIPLLVAAGAAGPDPGYCDYSDRILGKAVSGYRFG